MKKFLKKSTSLALAGLLLLNSHISLPNQHVLAIDPIIHVPDDLEGNDFVDEHENHYKLIGFLNSGNECKVYLCQLQQAPGSYYVVKIPQGKIYARDNWPLVLKVLREAYTTKKTTLSHVDIDPNTYRGLPPRPRKEEPQMKNPNNNVPIKFRLFEESDSSSDVFDPLSDIDDEESELFSRNAHNPQEMSTVKELSSPSVDPDSPKTDESKESDSSVMAASSPSDNDNYEDGTSPQDDLSSPTANGNTYEFSPKDGSRSLSDTNSFMDLSRTAVKRLSLDDDKHIALFKPASKKSRQHSKEEYRATLSSTIVTKGNTKPTPAIKPIPNLTGYTPPINSPYALQILSTQLLPNIVRIISLYPYIEEAYGENLLAYKHSNHLTEEQVKNWTNDILDALLNLNSLKLCHRDIKPENIFLDEKGQAIVGDLGAVCHYTEGLGKTVGSVGYMSPEVWNQEIISDLDTRAKSDVFSLGITALELLTNFEAEPQNMSDAAISAIANRNKSTIIQEILEDKYSLHNGNPLSSAWKFFLLTCLAPTPADRSTVAEAKDSLNNLLSDDMQTASNEATKLCRKLVEHHILTQAAADTLYFEFIKSLKIPDEKLVA